MRRRRPRSKRCSSSRFRGGGSRRTKQTPPQATAGAVPPAPVTIGVAALLELAAWCRDRLSEPPGETTCPPPHDAPLPPAPDQPDGPGPPPARHPGRAGPRPGARGGGPDSPPTGGGNSATCSAGCSPGFTRQGASGRAAMNDTFRSPKLRAWHLDRSAVVYVRQSTPQQVIDHQESTARQYALADRAVELGWAREHVLVIDDDLGKSGQSVEGRPGFQRLLAEVALDRVGLILGLEMSRLARSCKDWHHLIELGSIPEKW